jgi:hypothetical protein
MRGLAGNFFLRGIDIYHQFDAFERVYELGDFLYSNDISVRFFFDFYWIFECLLPSGWPC